MNPFCALPAVDARAIERHLRRSRPDIVNVPAAPGRRVGRVLVAAPDPVLGRRQGGIGERIARNAAQVPVPNSLGLRALDTIDEHLQCFGIAMVAHALGAFGDAPGFPVVVETIDGGTHLAQASAQLQFLFAADGDLGVRHGRRRQDRQDHEHHQQLDQRKTRAGVTG